MKFIIAFTLFAIILLLSSCQAVRDYRMAKAINDNIKLSEKYFTQYTK